MTAENITRDTIERGLDLGLEAVQDLTFAYIDTFFEQFREKNPDAVEDFKSKFLERYQIFFEDPQYDGKARYWESAESVGPEIMTVKESIASESMDLLSESKAIGCRLGVCLTGLFAQALMSAMATAIFQEQQKTCVSIATVLGVISVVGAANGHILNSLAEVMNTNFIVPEKDRAAISELLRTRAISLGEIH